MITSYATLQTELAQWLMRGDLGTMIPSFIQNAEAVMRRRLVGGPLKLGSVDIDAPSVALPIDCRYVRTLSVDGPQGPWVPKPTSYEAVMAERTATGGKPASYAIVEGTLVTAPFPDTVYTATIYYEEKIGIAGVPSGTSLLLSEWPDLYLYGALVESAPYLKADPRLPMWEARFNRILQEIRLAKERESYGGAPTARRIAQPLGI